MINPIAQDALRYVLDNGLEADLEERLREGEARMCRALQTEALPAEVRQLVQAGVLMAAVATHQLRIASASRKEGTAALETVAAACESPADRRRWRAVAREFERLTLVFAS